MTSAVFVVVVVYHLLSFPLFGFSFVRVIFLGETTTTQTHIQQNTTCTQQQQQRQHNKTNKTTHKQTTHNTQHTTHSQKQQHNIQI